jgi:phage minor structural protein
LIKIFNQQLQLVAKLENAYGIGYEKRFNEVSLAEFKLPLDDPKNAECNPFNFVEITDKDDYIGMFRIVPRLIFKSESNREIRYTLRHVISTLLDDVLFRYHQTTNLTTAQNIQYILDQQETTHWVLGTCEFTRYFHYKYENENGLLGPLFAIPKPFDVEYEWTYDTQSYPFVLNLVAPSTEVSCVIQEAHNQIGIEKDEPNEIVNRIYPLGYGEGVNQLGIEKVNNGIPYLEDTASIAKYGLQKYVWVDKRFEDANSLKANGQALLKKWANPAPAYRIAAADVSSITQADIHKLKCGRIVRVKDSDLGTFDLRIMSEKKPDIKGTPGNVDLEVGSLTEDIATVQADLERKMQINEAYSQGATNIDSYNYADNCDATHPAVIRFYIPEELVRINKMLLSYETSAFRAYSKATKGGGATTATSSSGGGTTATSSSGGGVSTSTASGGGTSTSSASGGNHNHVMFNPINEVPGSTPKAQFRAKAQNGTNVNVNLEAGFADIYTYGASGDHTHTVTVPAHTHSFSVPNHSHEVTVPNHSHNLTLPDHTHEILYGIFEGETPTAVTVKVDGNVIPSLGVNENDIDIIPYLSKDSEGKINRGTWHEVTITPNKMGRITANIATQLFLQSRGGGNY